MIREEVIETIKNMVSEISGMDAEKIECNASLMDEIEMSSLEVMTMIADIENIYGISIDEDSMAEVTTIEELAELIMQSGN